MQEQGTLASSFLAFFELDDRADFLTIDTWLHNKWLCWGAAPFIAAAIGFLLPSVILEVTRLYLPFLLPPHIVYGKGSSRKAAIQGTYTKLSYAVQWKGALWSMFGPPAMVNAVLGMFLCQALMPVDSISHTTHPSTLSIVFQLVCLLTLGDFFLYWGHRIQHMSPFLWENFHSYHHRIDTPSAVSAICIDPVDLTLQGGLPIIFSAAILRPHPLAYWPYIMLRVMDNIANHSGITSSFVTEALFLKALPFRGSVAHHDAHHKFSNYGANSKNFGEFFWIWDYIFGTYADVSKLGKASTD